MVIALDGSRLLVGRLLLDISGLDHAAQTTDDHTTAIFVAI
jgi:hypothetical protein